jgi:hypothetical protein
MGVIRTLQKLTRGHLARSIKRGGFVVDITSPAQLIGPLTRGTYTGVALGGNCWVIVGNVSVVAAEGVDGNKAWPNGHVDDINIEDDGLVYVSVIRDSTDTGKFSLTLND